MERPALLKIALVCFILASFQLEGNTAYKRTPCEPCGKYDHWFTGPVFTPNPTTVLPHHPVIEPILITSYTYGLYDDHWNEHSVSKMWSTGPYVDFQTSFTETFGIEFIGFMVSNFREDASSTNLKDTIFRAGYQISTDQQDSWVPDFRIIFQEIFPTGKYDKLHPHKKGTDLTGQGAFETGVHLVFQKLFALCSTHCLSIRGDVGYFFSAPVHVKGLNYYTGLNRVNGKVRPGNTFVGFLAFEWSLSPQWNICCETFYQYEGNGHFSGKVKKIEGMRPKIKVPAVAQLIIVPEIQRTITSKLGIIIGSATTLIGKNAPAFSSVFVSALYLF